MQQTNPVNGSKSYLRILCSRKYLLGILCTAFTNQKWNIQKQFRRNKPAQLSHCPDEIFRSTPDYRFEQHSAAWAAPSSYLGGSRIIYTHPTAREGACAILFYSIIDLYKIAVKTTHTSMIVLMSRQSHKMCTFRYISGANTLRGHGTGWSGWPVLCIGRCLNEMNSLVQCQIYMRYTWSLCKVFEEDLMSSIDAQTQTILIVFSRTKIPPPKCMRESGRGCCICFIITHLPFLYSHTTNSLNYILYFVLRNTFVDEIYNRHLISGSFRSRFISYIIILHFPWQVIRLIAKVSPALDVLPTLLPKRIGWKNMTTPRRINTKVASTFVWPDEKGHAHFSNISSFRKWKWDWQ